MWMINPKKLCRQHLLGEHKELHQLLGSINKNRSIGGHIEKGQVELHNLEKRHKELVNEMRIRGYNHQSPLKYKSTKKIGKINILQNYKELEKRCKECKKLINLK